jgi:hypothetical protein
MTLSDLWPSCLGNLVLLLQDIFNYLACGYFELEHIWWGLFQRMKDKCNKVWNLKVSLRQLVKQELLTLPEHLSSPPVVGGLRVVWTLVFCVVFCGSLFKYPLFHKGSLKANTRDVWNEDTRSRRHTMSLIWKEESEDTTGVFRLRKSKKNR